MNIKKIKFGYIAGAVWGVGLLAIAGIYFMLYAPGQDELRRLAVQAADMRGQLDMARRIADPQAGEKYAQTERARQMQIAGFAADQDQVAAVVFNIGQAAGELGLSGFSSRILPTPALSAISKSQRLTEALLSVEFKGTYGQFARMVNRLERSSPVVFVEKATVRRDVHGGREHEFKLELSLLAKKEAALAKQ